MKKSSLKDWFKIEVWRQSGGTLPELCDLADIREWLNETTFADGVGIVSAVEKLNESFLAPPTVIDLRDASEDYVIKGGKTSIVVIIDNAATPNNIVLPKAEHVGLRVTISNVFRESVEIIAADNDSINFSSTRATLEALTSATFYCFADRRWTII